MSVNEKAAARGTKDSAKDKFDYQEEFIRPAPPTMTDVKKLPRYDQRRPVVKHVEAYDHDHSPRE